MHADSEIPLLIGLFSNAVRMTASEKELLGNALLKMVLVVFLSFFFFYIVAFIYLFSRTACGYG